MTRANRIVVTVAGLIVASASVSACPACYGAPDSPMAAGMNTAILFMLGITGFVLTSIVGCFFLLWKRAKHHQAMLSAQMYVSHDGTLRENNEKGVVEWKNS
ncbi:MAG TPA: hypothetical protein VGR15_00560 [Bacteroidota bacterium]|jgi:hypothetical protein|nr:hypothetical protein [Bacteroidota bacterium]